jgi:hypothetical protein
MQAAAHIFVLLRHGATVLDTEDGREAPDGADGDDSLSECESSTRVQPSRSYNVSIMLPQSLAC